MQTPADRILKLLEKKGIKQIYLAEKIGMNASTLNGKLQKRFGFSPEEIESICGVLNCTPNNLLKPRRGLDEKLLKN